MANREFKKKFIPSIYCNEVAEQERRHKYGYTEYRAYLTRGFTRDDFVMAKRLGVMFSLTFCGLDLIFAIYMTQSHYFSPLNADTHENYEIMRKITASHALVLFVFALINFCGIIWFNNEDKRGLQVFAIADSLCVVCAIYVCVHFKALGKIYGLISRNPFILCNFRVSESKITVSTMVFCCHSMRLSHEHLLNFIFYNIG